MSEPRESDIGETKRNGAKQVAKEPSISVSPDANLGATSSILRIIPQSSKLDVKADKEAPSSPEFNPKLSSLEERKKETAPSGSIKKKELSETSKNRPNVLPHLKKSVGTDPEVANKNIPEPNIEDTPFRSMDERYLPALSKRPLNSFPSKNSVATQTLETPGPSSEKHPETCSRHPQATIAQGETAVLSGIPTLCENCSQSMLAYIQLVQKFLDGVAKHVSKQIDPITQCVECVKESINLPDYSVPQTRSLESYVSKEDSNTVRNSSQSKKHPEAIESHNKGTVTKSSGRQMSRSHLPSHASPGWSSDNSHQISTQHSSREAVSTYSSTLDDARQSHNVQQQKQEHQHKQHNRPTQYEDPTGNLQSSNEHQGGNRQGGEPIEDHKRSEGDSYQKHQHPTSGNLASSSQYKNFESKRSESQQGYFHSQTSETQTANDLQTEPYSGSNNSTEPMEQTLVHIAEDMSSSESFQGPPSPQFPPGEGVDGILSMLYKVERGLSDIGNGSTIWERLAEIRQEPLGRVNDEAFVTQARNNSDVLGCLVLGASLLLSGTCRTLCVIVSDGVSTAFMAPLSSVFHFVQHVRSLDSLGTTKLSLLDQPQLGISFGKLNVWRLEQFSKCVYLNPDTLVVQNCDELFLHEELSAVPDIGWPDCFNSGMFVFTPSIKTFWQLLEHAETQGSYDGGDQGLLNTYFHSWSQNVSQKLSFIYNLMANVSYTYTPAFKQFGRTVKIVQFLGSFKPWHVKFFSNNGQIAPSSALHPTYVQFVHVWLNLFRVCILPRFAHEIQRYASSQNVISAYELLRFFPTPVGSETDFLLTPPSVRMRPTILSPQTPSKPHVIEKLNLPQSPSSLPSSETTQNRRRASTSSNEQFTSSSANQALSKESEIGDQIDDVVDNAPHVSKLGEYLPEGGDVAGPSESLIPGAEVGDFQGMSAWEQGRMDYEGNASSDTIIQRLHYLMEKQDRLV